ncbi:hypothetical protein PBY51_018034 [Eleginops maclovinus]|uniref:Uncharacterized protein n=1 Tax=Eleginops maclovinus TaxID=56733 RepID=A0AAN8ANH6_ELEMC|nr:hypothetical protein PBY51_018034 [Eleginops maclovinus]
MISKNMHRVDMESGEVANKRPSLTADTMFYESAQQTFPVRKGKMSDIPEEPEDLSDSHPAIVPMKDAPPITEMKSPAPNYITVHYSKLSSSLFTDWEQQRGKSENIQLLSAEQHISVPHVKAHYFTFTS